MLKVLSRGQGYNYPCVLLLGGFDGMHVGHRSLVRAAEKYGCTAGLTSMRGNKRGGNVFTFPEREYIYKNLGLDFVYEIDFSEEFRNTPPEKFAEELFSLFSLRAVICGEDFRFGKAAAGTPQYLKKIAPCPVEVIPLMREGGEKVATSRMKELISSGNMADLNRFLCGGYFVQGTVEHGRGVGGKTLGFPTVNITFPRDKFPVKEGVYGGTVQTPSGEYPAIVNFGARPTFGVEESKVEAYLDGFSGDLYGALIRVYPKEYYRPVQKFPSAKELERQLARDVKRLHGGQGEKA